MNESLAAYETEGAALLVQLGHLEPGLVTRLVELREILRSPSYDDLWSAARETVRIAGRGDTLAAIWSTGGAKLLPDPLRSGVLPAYQDVTLAVIARDLVDAYTFYSLTAAWRVVVGPLRHSWAAPTG